MSFDAVRFVNNQQLEIGGENSSLLMPNNVLVYPSYPNPFNSSATIRYEVLHKQVVQISIFDISGNHINTLVDGLKFPGKYSVLWDGMAINNQTVPSGLYYCVVAASGFRNTQKIVLLK